MPYNNCQKIKEDGHRCNQQFRVPSHLWQLKFCPDCETNPKKTTNRRVAESNEIKMREYILSLMERIPDVSKLVIYHENEHLTGIEERVETVKGEVDEYKRVFGHIKSQLTRSRNYMLKSIEDSHKEMREELHLVKENFNQATEPEVVRINRHMLTLSNRIHQLEQKVFALIEEMGDVDC